MNFKESKEGDLIVRTYPNGTKSWWLNGLLHRADGPAIIWNDGTKEWYMNGDVVYSPYDNNLKDYPDLSEQFKKSIIRYELRRN